MVRIECAPLGRAEDRGAVQLIACPSCHVQYDVSNVPDKEIACRCGQKLEVRRPEAPETHVHRCAACGASVASDADACAYCGSPISDDGLSLVCPECYGRNEEDARFCTGCGVTFAPQPILGEGHEYPCPVCTSLMPARVVAAQNVNECPQCNGIWVPGDSFEVLVNRMVDALRERDPAKLLELKPRVKGGTTTRAGVAYRKCPQCDGFMQRKNFQRSSGVIIDVCRKHGTWLDADELEHIAGFLITGGRPRSARHLEKENERARQALAQVRLENIRIQSTQRTSGRDSLLDIFREIID